jgi:5-deoxy-glucuronate isomerase
MSKVLALGDPKGVDIGLYVVRLESGTSLDVPPVFHQCAAIVIAGSGRVTMCPTRGEELPPVEVARPDVWAAQPHSFLLPRGAGLGLAAGDEGMEIALVSAPGKGGPAPVHIAPAAVRVEERGEGQLDGTFHRQVRTVADGANARGWGLVFGEVVNRPGRWSSYPPHHHPQPEIYYRFDKPHGYGHAEIGEDVYKVRSHDITLMRAGEDHAQVSAPGYAMYYLWVIRNLKDQPYDTPEFAEEHRWLLNAR